MARLTTPRLALPPSRRPQIRWNEGGYVSELLLEKLSKRCLGWEVYRHAEPTPYPEHCINGPVVLLVDENTCSGA